MKRFMILGLFMVFSLSAAFAGDPDAIIGKWYNEEGTAQIEIYKQGAQYFGKIVWLKEPTYNANDVADNEGEPLVKLGAEKVDFKNPDTGRRSQKIIGLVILRDFTYDSAEGEWSNGMIYDPKKGSDYKCYMQLIEQNKLKIRGFIGFSLIGRTSYWSRAN